MFLAASHVGSTSAFRLTEDRNPTRLIPTRYPVLCISAGAAVSLKWIISGRGNKGGLFTAVIVAKKARATIGTLLKFLTRHRIVVAPKLSAAC